MSCSGLWMLELPRSSSMPAPLLCHFEDVDVAVTVCTGRRGLDRLGEALFPFPLPLDPPFFARNGAPAGLFTKSWPLFFTLAIVSL